MSDAIDSAYLPVEPDYTLIKPGMEVITEDAMMLGRVISIEPRSHRGAPNILFADTIHPLLNLYSSVYQISALEIATLGHHRIILAKDAIERIIEIKLGIFRAIGLGDSLSTRIKKKQAAYKQAKLVSQKSIDRYSSEPLNTWDDEFWNEDDLSDDEPPYSRVPVPKKPNPNLPPLMMAVSEDGDDLI
jgi:hypothetical protein